MKVDTVLYYIIFVYLRKKTTKRLCRFRSQMVQNGFESALLDKLSLCDMEQTRVV